ncbi:MAG: hypothetical protein ACREIM_09845 [Nitrospiraceae bacterium]
MHLSFVFIAAVGLLYFLLCLRQFDLFSVAFLSGWVYFLPGFFGYTVAPMTGAMHAPVDLENQTYVVMMAVLIAIWFGALLSDYAPRRDVLALRLQGSESAPMWAVTLAVIGYLLLVATAGEALLLDDKITMMESLNRWHILGATAAPLGAVLSFACRRWFLCALSMMLLLFDMYIGFRVSFAIAMIAIVTLYLVRDGTQRLAIKNWKIGCMGMAFVSLLLVYKQIFVAMKLGMWDVIAERIQDTDLYTTAIMMSEPFNTQAILNEVVAQDFRVGMGHLRDISSQFVLFSPELGGAPLSFNDLFQPTLFPSDLDYGMANNIWAEMLSSGGWPLLGLFIGIFVSMLLLGSYLIRSRDPILAAGAALTFSYWAFYIHRNDLLYQINLEKRTILVWTACVVLSQIFRAAHFRDRAKHPGSHGVASVGASESG